MLISFKRGHFKETNNESLDDKSLSRAYILFGQSFGQMDGVAGRIRLECNYCGPISIMRREAECEQNVVGTRYTCILIIDTAPKTDKAFSCCFAPKIRQKALMH